MRHYALIGEHLGHSLSVPIHEAVFRRLGLDADYRLIGIPRDRLADEAPRLLRELDGFNVTIPYKREIMPFLTRIDPEAERIGAVNTVRTRPEAEGYNTDVGGFAAMLRHAGIDPAGRPCFVLGTGGASLAVCAALRRLGAAEVTTVSRHPAEGSISYGELPERFSGVLVNTTPVGMWPDVSGCPIDPAVLPLLLRRAEGVADVIYNPAETVLTAAARARGIPAITGLYMLIAQALEAEAIWQERPVPEDLIAELMEELQP